MIPFGSHLGRYPDLCVEEAVNSKPSLFSVKRFREKRWSYIGIINEECILGCALVHIGFAANAFCFLFDRQERKIIEKGYVIPPFSGLDFDRDPDNGECILKANTDSIEMLHHINESKRILKLNVAPGSAREMTGELLIHETPSSKPLQLFTPMTSKGEKGRKVFTQKIAGLAAEGEIKTSNRTFNFDKHNSFAIFDWTNGFHDRVTQWNWASAGGLSKCGKRIGINFSKGVYKQGFGENVIWIDDEPQLESEICFDYSTQKPMDDWKIYNREKTIELSFSPEGKRQANENFGVAASNFIQACGHFSGFVTDTQGKKIEIENLGGVVEEHYALW